MRKRLKDTVRFSTLKDGDGFYNYNKYDWTEYTKGVHPSYKPRNPGEDFHPNAYKLTEKEVINVNMGEDVPVIKVT